MRTDYDYQWGSDAEQSVNVYFKAYAKDVYKPAGWKDEDILISLLERDAFHDYPYFNACYKNEEDKSWKYKYLSNHIEAIEYLQSKNLI